MPVLEWAVPGAALIFLPMLLGSALRGTARAGGRHRRTAHPAHGIGALDSIVTTLSLEPDEAAAVLHGMLDGPITPTYEERHAIDAPTLVIGHKVDFIHPFTDADHLDHDSFPMPGWSKHIRSSTSE